MLRNAKRGAAAALAALVVAAISVASPSSAQASSYCGIRWGSLAKQQPRQVPGPITNVRAGRHACFDRMVIDIHGRAAGYRIAYVSNSAMGIPLRGAAQLDVHVRASRYAPGDCWACESARYEPANGRDVVPVAGFRTIRQVALVSETGFFAPTPDGGEVFTGGETEFGVGVRARLPFRVFWLQSSTASRLVIDVAHRW
jgi:hypothetical protein